MSSFADQTWDCLGIIKPFEISCILDPARLSWAKPCSYSKMTFICRKGESCLEALARVFWFSICFLEKNQKRIFLQRLALFLEVPSDADVIFAGNRSKNDRNDLNKCNFGLWLWYRQSLRSTLGNSKIWVARWPNPLWIYWFICLLAIKLYIAQKKLNF